MAELLATYRDPEHARQAITTLERHGVDGAHIHLLEAPGARGPKTDAATHEPDMAVTREVGRRGFAMAFVVAIVLGLVAAAIGYAIAGGTAALIAGVGFFMAGGPLGFFYGGASAVSVSDEWAETYETAGPTTLAITVHHDDELIDLRDRLESTHPDRIMVS